MKHRRIIVAAIATSALAVGGCASVDQAFVAECDTFANTTVLPDYERYVANDLALSADEKADRLFPVNEYRKAVDAAKRRQEGR